MWENISKRKKYFRPLRTLEEEHSFIYGAGVGDGECCDNNNVRGTGKEEAWVGGGGTRAKVDTYLQRLPAPAPGPVTEDAVRRIKQLEKQFPLHDVEPEKCHELSPGEVDRMESYVDNLRRNIAGQGVVTQLEERPPSPPPPPMPPPMKLLPIVTRQYDKPEQPQQQQVCSANHLHEPCHVTRISQSPRYVSGVVVCGVRGPHAAGRGGRVRGEGGRGHLLAPGLLRLLRVRRDPGGPPLLLQVNCYLLLTFFPPESKICMFSQGKLYCGRHFAAKMNIPRCAACDELIFSVEFTAAEDRWINSIL